LPQDQWWAGIAPYFTSSSAEVYHWTDVRNVTARGVDPAGAVLLPTSLARSSRPRRCHNQAA